MVYHSFKWRSDFLAEKLSKWNSENELSTQNFEPEIFGLKFHLITSETSQIMSTIWRNKETA